MNVMMFVYLNNFSPSETNLLRIIDLCLNHAFNDTNVKLTIILCSHSQYPKVQCRNIHQSLLWIPPPPKKKTIKKNEKTSN